MSHRYPFHDTPKGTTATPTSNTMETPAMNETSPPSTRHSPFSSHKTPPLCSYDMGVTEKSQQ